uniref:polynucleotide adenylyltransferase n=1 Tax=Globodera rostochiensis TaxID=31243 RepID=A0A914IA64_GLORO
MYFELMFSETNKFIEEFLHYAILSSQIFAYFIGYTRESEGIETEVNGEMESLWQLFLHVTGDVRLVKQNANAVQLIKREDQVGPLHIILNILKNGNYVKTIDRRPKLLLEDLANGFVNLYEESETFRKCFGEQIHLQRRLKEMIKKADDEADHIVPDQFWRIFEENENEETALSKEQRQKAMDFTVLIKINDECPDENISIEELKENDRQSATSEGPFAYTLMERYIDLLWKNDGILSSQLLSDNLLRDIEIRTIILYYRDRVKELFSQAQYHFGNENFIARIDTFLNEWVNELKDEVEAVSNDAMEQKMCKIYQFVYKIVTDNVLMETNKHWTEIMSANVIEGNMDSTKFISIGMFHMFALIRLISAFNEIRSTFCHGPPENISRLKLRIIASASLKILDRLEMLFPQVMHYDKLMNSQLFANLLKQLEYKSGTVQAENLEARSSTSLLLLEINIYESKLRENGYKALLKKTPEIREALLDLIEKRKRKFYVLLNEATNEQCVMRKAMCPLHALSELLEKVLLEKGKKSVTELRKWYPKECEREEGIKRSFEENRVHFRIYLRNLFVANSESLKIFYTKAAEIGGAKTRFLKFISSDASRTILPDRSGDLLLEKLWEEERVADELFNNDSLLSSLYSAFLITRDSMAWLSIKLKLDLFVFVRWFNAKISLFTGNNNSLHARRLAKFWAQTKLLFVQLYDRTYKKLEEQLMELHIKTIHKLAEEDAHFMDRLKFNSDELPEYLGKETLVQIWKEIDGIRFGTSETKLDEKCKTSAEESQAKLKKKKSKSKKHKNADDKTAQVYEKLAEEEGTTTPKTTKTEKQQKAEGTVDKTDTVGEEAFEEGDDQQTTNQSSGSRRMPSSMVISCSNRKTPKTELPLIGQQKQQKAEGTVDKTDTVGEEAFEEGDDQQTTNQSSGSARMPSSMVISCSNDNFDYLAVHGVEAEAEGIKLNNFADDQFLLLQYAEFVAAAMASTEQQNDRADIAKLIKLLNVGALINEIFHRMEAIEWWGGDRWQNAKAKKRIVARWECLLESKNARNDSPEGFLLKLTELLRDVLREMDGFWANSEKFENNLSINENDRNVIEFGGNCQELVNQLHSRNFGIAIAGEKVNNWAKMSNIQKKMALLNLFGKSDDGIEDETKNEKIFAKFIRNLELFKKAETQRELDQIIFLQYKNDSNLTQFIEKKDKSNFDNNSKIFPTEKWQELNSTDEIERKLNETEKVKNALKLDDLNGREIVKHLLIKLSIIFNDWSDEARFLFPSLHFLRHTINKYETICILPDGFNHNLIFGKFECDNYKNSGGDSGEHCSDNSLYCALCKKLHLTFIQKQPNHELSYVPMLKIGLENVQIDVKFVQIPECSRIPRINFNAKQLEIFLIKFAQNIHKLEDNDHFDEGVYWHETQTRKELRKKYENAEKNNAKNAEEMEKFDKITELFHLSRKNALRQRQMVKERKETLFVLSDDAFYKKLLQFLLLKNDYETIINKFELNDEFGIKTLDKFRTIFAYLERWAQNNHIFCQTLGYLSTKMLLLMLTKVFLLFPDSTTPFLIDKFFLIYSEWKWPMPVQLTELSDKRRVGEFLNWTPAMEWFGRRHFAWENLPKNVRTDLLKNIRKEMAMAVITPTFPERNLAENVNISSAKVLQNELKKALKKIRIRRDLDAIIEPIRAIKFTEKYEHFIVVECIGPKFNVEKFCEFVGKRLRFELLEFVEKPLAIWVDFCHVFPKMISPRECSSDSEQKNKNLNNSICERFWLVGIELAPNQKAISAFKGKLKTNLQKKFDKKIRNDFERGSFHNVRLKSEVAQRENLQNWRIDPTI